ncbi:MAG: hypothetical protein MJA83_10630 [Gammaproteobacteria bacterium]|nr:hypothetical protein [Gammaproteobacteria bacterium]
MVSIISLWMPILLSALAVFFMSFIIWTVLPYHKTDYRAVEREEDARNALRGLSPGQYNIPNIADWGELKKPEVKQKFEEGPLAYVTVMPSGLPKMGGKLTQWFVFNLVMSVFAAYLAGRALTTGADFASVMRITATITFLAYGAAEFTQAIWYGRPWSMTLKTVFDALLYGLATGGIFGWLWPS